MFPYNKATNRKNKKKGGKSGTVKNATLKRNAEGKEEEILWDFEEYRLTYVLENFQLPQIVRVVEGFMFTEEDSLASGIVLTLHGQQKVQQIHAIDDNGNGSDVFIPISCPYRVRVTVPDREVTYRTVKDLCNATPLPKCVLVQEKISFAGVKIPTGRWLIVKSISKDKNDQAQGITVELIDYTVRNLVLPMKTVGNFAPCPLPPDQGRAYFIRELCDRCFPLWVMFTPTADREQPYGPHMGIVKLIKLQSMDVVFSTTEIDGEKFAISFSKSLPVTVEVARGMLDSSATYSRRCKVAEEETDFDVLSHVTDANPYSSMYQSAIYADVCEIRKAFQHRAELYQNSRCSSDSFQSDTTSFSEDRQSELKSLVDRSNHSNGSPGGSLTGSLQPGKTLIDASSFENEVASHASKDEDEIKETFCSSGNGTCKMTENGTRKDSCDECDDDYDDGDDYEIIADKMDAGIHQAVGTFSAKKAVDSGGTGPTTEVRGDVTLQMVAVTSKQSKDDFDLPLSLPGRAKLPPKKARSLTSTDSLDSEMRPYSSRRSVAKTVPEVFSHNYMEIDHVYVHHSPDRISLDSDTESLKSEYHSVKSISGLFSPRRHHVDAVSISDQQSVKRFETEVVNDNGAGSESGRRSAPRKPERPKWRPRVDVKPFRDQDTVQVNSMEKDEKEVDSSSLGCREPLVKSDVKELSSDLAKEDDSKVDEADSQRAVESPYKSITGPNEALSNNGETLVTDLDENDVCRVLEDIQLSEFKGVFKEEQVNGALLSELDIETLISLGLNTFQAIKLVTYVQGWRPNEAGRDEAGGNEATDQAFWTARDVFGRMQEINLEGLATFCLKNQVDGRLLESVIDNQGFDCLKREYSVQLNKIHEKKVIRYVKDGWRPDAILKR